MKFANDRNEEWRESCNDFEVMLANETVRFTSKEHRSMPRSKIVLGDATMFTDAIGRVESSSKRGERRVEC